MNIPTLLPLISAIAVFVLGVMVFIKGKREKINSAFFLFAMVTTVWMFGTFMMFLNKSNLQAIIFWDKFVYVGVVFIPVIMYQFGLALIKNKSKINSFLLYLGYALSFFFLILIPTNAFVSGAYIYQWGAHSRAQFFHHIFLFYFAVYILYWFYIVFHYYKAQSSLIERTRVKYCFWAYAILATFGPLGYLPAYGIGIYPFAYISGLIFTVILAYAIVAHHFLDIKLVMRRYSVYLMSLSLILILAVGIKYFSEIWFYDYSTWADPLILIGALYIFTPVRNYFYRLANKYFFSSLYDSGEVIASLSDKLRTTLDAGKIYDFTYQILTGAFHAKAFGLLIYNEKAGNFTSQYNNGFNIGLQKSFPEDKALNEMFIKKNKPIITEDIKRLSQFDKNPTLSLLKKIGVEILAPLNVKDKTIGLIALGVKESGDMYNDEDLQVLEVAGAQMAIALENALLYKETKDFNIKLEKEVEKATRDLRKANAQLKKLDAAKSEFISIASHQLRTPLTVIKGYISMMLEGNFGPLSKMEEESLHKVFESNERLIQLVENLLNISRIESGRLQFNYQDTDLNKMVESVMEELEANAKKKGLILQYKSPAKPVSVLKLDDEKIRQVVMNLIDNAIKYTKQGSVTVKLEQDGDKIKFCVADSGMGIRPEDMGNLFKKFSRGTGTSLIHTEGTGLGLYVARMMIEAHKGKIWAESDGEGKGSKFCFELPTK